VEAGAEEFTAELKELDKSVNDLDIMEVPLDRLVVLDSLGEPEPVAVAERLLCDELEAGPVTDAVAGVLGLETTVAVDDSGLEATSDADRVLEIELVMLPPWLDDSVGITVEFNPPEVVAELELVVGPG
jgi:hypothetical protein